MRRVLLEGEELVKSWGRSGVEGYGMEVNRVQLLQFLFLVGSIEGGSGWT